MNNVIKLTWNYLVLNTYLPAWANQNWAFRQIISTVTWYCTITTPSPNKVYNTEKSVTNRVTVCPVAWPQLTASFTPCETTLLWNQLQHSQYAARNKVLQYLFQSRTAPDVLFVDKILLPSVQLTATKPVHKYPKNTYSFLLQPGSSQYQFGDALIDTGSVEWNALSQKQHRSILACISPTAYKVNMIYYYVGIWCFIRLAEGTYFSGMNEVRGWKETTI